MKRCLSLLIFLALGARASAFVTSATLEYSAPHPVHMYLNGVEIKNYDSQFAHFNDYALLCSADGSLPLELFKYKQDNVLAIHQKGFGGWHEFTNMGVSYRLTVYQSAGAPVVVWSDPGNTKYLHFEPGQQPPAGWEKPGFDDSAWKDSISARMITDYWGWAELPDAAFKGFLGKEGYVPFLSNNKVGAASAGMVNVFRSRFRVPYKPGKLALFSAVKQAKQGDKVLVRLIPARDCATMGSLQVSASLPQGLKPVQAPGAAFDQASRRLSWNFPSPAKSLATNIQSVVENKGFVLPHKAFGPWKANRPPKDYIRNMTSNEYYDSSTFPSGASCWFQMSPPPFKDGPDAPIILSVTFQSQILPRGFNGLISYSVDYIMFNYSVDGGLNGEMAGQGVNLSKVSGGGPSPDTSRGGPRVPVRGGGALGSEGVNLSKFAGGNGSQNWANGYYDATYDRRWTWADLENLRVSFKAKQVGDRKLDNLLLSCVASVRYYDPKEVAPYFYAEVTEPACKVLNITASLNSLSNDSSATASDSIAVNQRLCAPTPMPTATRVPTRVPTPRPGVTPPTPVPTAVPTVVQNLLVNQRPRITEVKSAPEPFRRGGVFLYFTLGGAANVVNFIVYDAAGKPIANVDAGAFGAGKNQIFYDGLADTKKALAPGRYSYEIRARVDNVVESFRGSFSRESDKFQ